MKKTAKKQKSKNKNSIIKFINEGRLSEFIASHERHDLPESALELPSDDAIKRYDLIPLYYGKEISISTVHGNIAYDSWSQGAAVSLRDVTEGHVRRIQFKAKNISLEIVAERRQDHWEYIARIYYNQKVTHDFILKVGTLKVLPFSGGFYHWTSRTVPGTIKLLSYKQNILFDKLSWQ